MVWRLAGVLLLIASGCLAADSKPSAEVKPTIFAVAFTSIDAHGAELVFTTTEPATAQVTVRCCSRAEKTTSAEKASEIHRVRLSDLPADEDVHVDIKAKTENGVEFQSLDHHLKTGERKPVFGTYPGKMLFGIQGVIDLDLLKELRPGMARVSLVWSAIEPDKRGDIKTDALEKFGAKIKALRELNIEPLFLLCFSTQWALEYTHRQMTWRNRVFGPPDTVEDWRSYVQTVMKAFKGDVHYYEVWNEPDAGYLAAGKAEEAAPTQKDTKVHREIYKDNNEYWLGDRYVPLVMAVRDTADAVDKDIEVFGGAWNHDYHGSRAKIVFNRGMQRYIQQYSFHNYTGKPHSYAGWEANTKLYFENADAAFNDFGIKPPIAVTEWGIETYDEPPAKSGFSSRHDGQIFLVKSAFFYLGLQRVTCAILHQLGYDDAWSLANKDKDGKVVTTKLFDTYKWICAAFNNKAYKRIDVKASGCEALRAYAIQMEGDGSVYVALWQDHYDEATKMAAVLAAATAKCEIPALAAGSYVRQTLGLTGQVTATEEVTVTNGLKWDEHIPEATAAAESEVVLYRFVKK